MSRSGLCLVCAELTLAEQCRGNAGEPGPARDRWITGVLDYAARLGGSTLTPDELAALAANTEVV